MRFFLLLIFAIPALAQVTGVVTDQAGNPLTNITVSNGKRQAFTDEEGRFQFTESGTIRIVRCPGYLEPAPQSAQPNEQIRFTLLKGAVVTGQVWEKDGSIAAKKNVHLVDSTGKTIKQTITNDAGVYRIYGIPAGTYYVQVEKTFAPNNATQARATKLHLEAGEEHSALDIRLLPLLPPLEIKGILNGAKEGLLSVYQDEVEIHRQKVSQTFEISLPAGSYKIAVSNATQTHTVSESGTITFHFPKKAVKHQTP